VLKEGLIKEKESELMGVAIQELLRHLVMSLLLICLGN